MEQIFIFSCIAGILAILYGFITARKVLSMPTGTKKMQEIASAIQEGASAYLKRQYYTIPMWNKNHHSPVSCILGLKCLLCRHKKI